jgi:hypothetical protein
MEEKPMRNFLIIALLLYAVSSFAADAVDDVAEKEWNNTTLSDALIKKIQESSYQYRKCAADEMQKPAYATIEFRKATEEAINQCEPVLAKIREVYLTEKVPEVIIDRQLKTMRIQTTRKVLTELMFRDAARKAGAEMQQPKLDATKKVDK